MSENAADLNIKEDHPVNHKPRKKLKLGLLLTLLAALISLGILGYGYMQLAQINITLANTVTHLESQSTNAQQQVANLQKSVEALQQTAQKTQTDQWYATEAQYLVRLANDHLQYTHDQLMVVSLLQRADQTLQATQDNHLLEVRKSLTNDIATVQAAPHPDISGIYLQLSTLNDQVGQLPLPANPLQNTSKQTTDNVDTTNMPWWKVGLERSLQTLRQIVIVRQYRPEASPLVMPDEKEFLYQNFHAQLEAAMWGALHRNAGVYQASLARSVLWAQQYFDQDAPTTKTMVQRLKELQKIDVQPPVLSLSATLQLFDAYFVQAAQGKSA